MLDTIETKLADARRLVNGVETEYCYGDKQRALNGLKEAITRLLVLKLDMEAELAPADEALQFGCGHCGHECPVSELNAGKCPKCGTVKDGVLVVPRVDRWQEREEAPLRKPQGHAVRLNGWTI